MGGGAALGAGSAGDGGGGGYCAAERGYRQVGRECREARLGGGEGFGEVKGRQVQDWAAEGRGVR